MINIKKTRLGKILLVLLIIIPIIYFIGIYLSLGYISKRLIPAIAKKQHLNNCSFVAQNLSLFALDINNIKLNHTEKNAPQIANVHFLYYPQTVFTKQFEKIVISNMEFELKIDKNGKMTIPGIVLPLKVNKEYILKYFPLFKECVFQGSTLNLTINSYRYKIPFSLLVTPTAEHGYYQGRISFSLKKQVFTTNLKIDIRKGEASCASSLIITDKILAMLLHSNHDKTAFSGFLPQKLSSEITIKTNDFSLLSLQIKKHDLQINQTQIKKESLLKISRLQRNNYKIELNQLRIPTLYPITIADFQGKIMVASEGKIALSGKYNLYLPQNKDKVAQQQNLFVATVNGECNLVNKIWRFDSLIHSIKQVLFCHNKNNISIKDVMAKLAVNGNLELLNFCLQIQGKNQQLKLGDYFLGMENNSIINRGRYSLKDKKLQLMNFQIKSENIKVKDMQNYAYIPQSTIKGVVNPYKWPIVDCNIFCNDATAQIALNGEPIVMKNISLKQHIIAPTIFQSGKGVLTIGELKYKQLQTLNAKIDVVQKNAKIQTAGFLQTKNNIPICVVKTTTILYPKQFFEFKIFINKKIATIMDVLKKMKNMSDL